LVYCDPKSWSKDPEKLHLLEGCVVAVRVHPKYASDFGDYYFDRLSMLMRTLSQEFLDPCTGVQSKPPERLFQMHIGIIASGIRTGDSILTRLRGIHTTSLGDEGLWVLGTSAGASL
jgi:hypothetical protein